MLHFRVRLVQIIVLTTLLGACKLNSYQEGVVPDFKGISKVRYPLEVVIKPGFSGSITLEKNEDGTPLAEVRIQGMKPGFRYFGKISKSNASDFSGVLDIADLGEIEASTGIRKSWLKVDYNNRPLVFDSLISSNAMVRILEVSQNTGSNVPGEVLRGDIGSNVLKPDSAHFEFKDINTSGIVGKLVVRQRKNGNFLLTARIKGLTGVQSLPLTFFRGNYETSTFTKIREITKYSVGTNEVTFGLPELVGGIQIFDTLQGFIGLESDSSVLSNIQLLSICNFGGNKVSSNQITYPVYSDVDSTLIATVKFQEIGAAGGKILLTFNPIAINGSQPHYLTIHEGTSLDPPDTIFTRLISNSEPRVFQNITDRDGNLIDFTRVKNWSANVRIVDDPIGFSNVIGKADLGQNAVSPTDSIVRVLNLINPSYPGYGGSVILRRRLNGKTFVVFRLFESFFGVENTLEIKVQEDSTSFEEGIATPYIFNVTPFQGGLSGQPYKGILELKNSSGSPALWSDLLLHVGQQNIFVQHSFYDEPVLYPLSRGKF